jgi:hypothetical protein
MGCIWVCGEVIIARCWSVECEIVYVWYKGIMHYICKCRERVTIVWGDCNNQGKRCETWVSDAITKLCPIGYVVLRLVWKKITPRSILSKVSHLQNSISKIVKIGDIEVLALVFDKWRKNTLHNVLLVLNLRSLFSIGKVIDNLVFVAMYVKTNCKMFSNKKEGKFLMMNL